MITIAYITSNLFRRILIVLILIFSPLLLTIGFLIRFWESGFNSGARYIKSELTQGGEGFRKTVAKTWAPPETKEQMKIRVAKRLVGRGLDMTDIKIELDKRPPSKK
jgi:hypothetical protein